MGRHRSGQSASRPQRVFLVERHALLRRTVAEWINRCDGLTVCGTAGSQAAALKALQLLRPDIVVSEIMRPHDLGFIRELHRRHPRLPILVFSLEEPALYAPRASAAGASGYVSKAAGGAELARNIRALLRRARLLPRGPVGGGIARAARRGQAFAESTKQRAERGSAAGRLCELRLPG